MSPEQVTGGPVNTGTDVYAFGVLLYLLLTGKHPAESALHSPADLIKAIVDTQPLRPSDVVASISNVRRLFRGDLDTIVAKALKKVPAERYVSVTALADDLGRYLRNVSCEKIRSARIGFPSPSLPQPSLRQLPESSGPLSAARAARMERDLALREFSRIFPDAARPGKIFTLDDLFRHVEELPFGRGDHATSRRAVAVHGFVTQTRRMQIAAFIADPELAAEILTHLGLSTPPRGPPT